MLEYFNWKKIRARKEACTAASAAEEASTANNAATETKIVTSDTQPVLSHHDEAFLCEQLESAGNEPVVILSGEDSGASSPVPSPIPAHATTTTTEGKATTSEWTAGIKSRFGDLRRTVSSAAERRKKGKSPGPEKGKGKGKGKEGEKEGGKEGKAKDKETLEVKVERREEDELTAVLEGLNLAAENGRAFSMSPNTKALLDKFILILKDLSNGVPTAYQDLIDFFDSSSKTLEDTFTNLPSFLQKIIRTLPTKMQAKVTPALLRTAAAVSPAAAAEAEALGSMFTLQELVTTPGLLMGVLKSVMNFLKLRFPMALGGTSLALSMGLFVVLFVLWYCYKRGREVRLEAEAAAAAAAAELLGGEDDAVVADSSVDVPEVVVGGDGKKVNV